MRILYVTESMGWSGGAHQMVRMGAELRNRGQVLFLPAVGGEAHD